MPAARGAEAEVPVWVSVQSLCRSALVWGVSGEKETWENMWGVWSRPWGLTLPRAASALIRKASWFDSLLPLLGHRRMFAICWYFSSLSSICNLSIILASECLFWGWSPPTVNFFFFSLLRFPNEMLSVKKGLFQNRCESCWPINHQVHCVWPGIFRNFASCPIPHYLQIDIWLPLQQKEVVLILATWTTCTKRVECVSLALTVDVFWWPGVSIMFLLWKWRVFQMKVC